MSRFNEDNEIACMSSGIGYEWCEVHVFYVDGRYWVDAQSGCSCNSYEYPDVLEPCESQHAALAEAIAEMREDWFDAADGLHMREEIMSHRPEKESL